MKEKILVALKTKYSNLGFGAKALDGVASILEKSVTDESCTHRVQRTERTV